MGYERIRLAREQAILVAAKSCFVNNGIINTSIKDISDKANISRQTFYKYFDGIDKLIYKVQFDCMKNMMSYVLSFPDENITALDAVKSIIMRMFEFCDKNPNEILYITTFDSYMRQHDMATNFKKQYSEEILKTSALEILIRKGQQEGTIRDDLSAELLQCVLFHTMMGLAQRTVILEDRMNLSVHISRNEFIDGIYSMFERYISAI